MPSLKQQAQRKRSKKYLSTPAGKAKKRASHAAWVRAHPERAREIARMSAARRAKDPAVRARRNAASSRWKKAHPEEVRRRNRAYYQKPGVKAAQKRRIDRCALKKYNLTPEQYQELLRGQNGACAICLQIPAPGGKRLAVDHCHKTDRVRGLLCTGCNLAVGNMSDDAVRLRAAAAYIERTRP